ncbi:hypothetical protein SIN8267_03557 [Sinobacterium norvegicum]|uniref:Cadherin domain-containing protein n=1 Tax=Sinobacterium norvegicum TaxID=1641715 RepID=A0ABN8ELY4_9GAMM|nr:hypothetical protein SIN8267_03557 [Sinobacterium norvegicum]
MAATPSNLGSLAIDAISGAWTYEIDNTLTEVQQLGTNETLSEFFTVTINDGQGGIVDQVIEITITGTNDAPMISGGPASVILTESDIALSSNGVFSVTDVDITNVVSSSVRSLTIGGSSNRLDIDAPSDAELKAMLSTSLNLDGSTDTANLSWNFNSASETFDYLAKGETLELTYVVAATDSDGSPLSDTETVTVTITGSNDNPTLTIDDTGAVTEDDSQSVLSDSGTLSFTDVDSNDVGHSISHSFNTDTVWSGGTLTPAQITALTATNFTTDGSGWDYEVNNSLVDFLAKDETITFSYDVTVSDLNGGSDTKTVEITITGTNDIPVITPGGDVDGDIYYQDERIPGQGGTTGNNASKASISGDLDATDVDTTDPQNWSITDPAGTYGTLSINNNGTWTYDFNDDRRTKNKLKKLKEGQEKTETFEVVVADGKGGFDTVAVVITITGTNDVPSIQGKSLKENINEGDIEVSDKLRIFDADQPNSIPHDIEIKDGVQIGGGNEYQVTGTYGSIVLDTVTGEWTYTLDNTPGGATDQLRRNQKVRENFEVTVTDEKGGTVTKNIQVTVKGTNDAPVLEGVEAAIDGAVIEDVGNERTTGTFGSSDIDNRAKLTHSVDGETLSKNGKTTIEGEYGFLTLSVKNGTWVYKLYQPGEPGYDKVQAIGDGVIKTEEFDIVVKDQFNASDSDKITITVEGTNDAPIITGKNTQSVVEDNPGNTKSGTLKHGDIDEGDTLNWSVSKANGSDVNPNDGAYGSLTINELANGNGRWTYTLDNTKASTQSLAKDQVVTEVFEVTVDDGKGGTDTIEVEVTITGTNDAPDITAASDVIGGVTEDNFAGNPSIIDSGQLYHGDVDQGATQTWQVINPTGSFGSLSVDEFGEWTFTLDNDSVQHLGIHTDVLGNITRDSVTDSFRVKVTDEHGASSEVTVDIVIEGSNDTPTIAGKLSGSVIENYDDAIDTSTATGQVKAIDVDNNDSHSWAFNNGTPNAAGSFGAIAIDAATGQWVYTLDSDLAATEQLIAGEKAQETFTVVVDDGNGGTNTETIIIDIVGSNSSPTATVSAESITENDPTTLQGQLDSGDPDHTDNHYWTLGSTNDTSQYGKLTLNIDGSWEYQLFDNNAVNAIKLNDTRTDSFTVTVTDEKGLSVEQTVEISIVGTNDAPVITGNNTRTMAEDSSIDPDDASKMKTGGTVNSTDIDQDAALTWSSDVDAVNGSGSNLGVFTFNTTTGEWDYRVDLDKVQYLAPGQTLTESFIVTSTDEHGLATSKTITVNVTGTNDTPTVIGGTPADGDGWDVIEDAADNTVGGILSTDGNDADDSPSFTAATYNGSYGSFTISADGTWLYTLDNTRASTNQLAEGSTQKESFTVVAIDEHGKSVTHTIDIDVIGSNDAPTIFGTSQAAVAEFLLLETQGRVIARDIDDGDTIESWSVAVGNEPAALTVDVADSDSEIQGIYGKLILQGDGSWVYQLDNDDQDVKDLTPGQIAEEVFYVTANDGSDDSAPHKITIEVTGSQDRSSGSGGVNPTPEDPSHDLITDTVKEDTTITGNTFDFSGAGDINPNTISSVVALADIGGAFGNITVTESGGVWSWQYVLDNDSILVQSLDEGESITETYYVRVTDANGTHDIPVEITINGTSDDPIIDADWTTGNVTEDTVLSTSSQISFDDVDPVDVKADGWAITDGAFGTASIDSDGRWIYTLNNNNDTVQALNPGESMTDVVTVTITDVNNQVYTQDLTITIHGTHDALELTVPLNDVNTAVQEDLVVTENVTVDIPSEAPNSRWTLDDGNGSYGQLGYNSDTDSWDYTLNNSAVQSLAEGEQRTDTFTVYLIDQYGKAVLDLNGDPATTDIVVTIDGTNDLPVLKNSVVSASFDIDTGTVSNTVKATDVDQDNLSWTTSESNDNSPLSGTNGTLTLASNGEWSYSLSAAGITNLAGLGKNESANADSFTVYVDDGSGNYIAQTINIEVTGNNKAPIISGNASEFIGSVTEDDAALSTATGKLDISDPNTNDTVSFNAVVDSAGTYGKFSIDSDGNWDYVIDNSSHVNALKAGETRTETFVVRGQDQHGSLVSETVTITIVGANDTSVIGGTTTGNIKELAPGSITGALVVSDDDSGDTAAWSILTSADPSDNGANYGIPSIDPVTGVWSYQVDPSDPTANSLAKGETLQDTFTVLVTDGSGDVTSQLITVTIVGENNAPAISGVLTEDVGEDTTSISGQLDSGDTDLSEINDDSWQIIDTPANAEWGSISIDDTGKWTFVVNTSKAQELADGMSQQLDYQVSVTDPHGEVSTKTVSVTIVGSNDLPVITGTDSDTVNEDTDLSGGNLLASGKLNITDADLGQALFSATVVNNGLYGNLTIDSSGQWNYSAANNQAAIQALSEGEPLTDTITISAADGTLHDIVITIIGTNDIPVIGGDDTGLITESNNPAVSELVASGKLDIADDDTLNGISEARFSPMNLTNSLGVFVLLADGNWSFTADNNNPLIQQMGENDSTDLRFTAVSADGSNSQEIVVTVSGVNDAATITATTNPTPVVQEDSGLDAGFLVTSGTVTVIDEDSGESVMLVREYQGNFGKLTMQEDGQWQYRADNSQTAIDELNEQSTPLQDSFTVLSADDSELVINIIIEGTNDQPKVDAITPLQLTIDNAADTNGVDGAVIASDAENDSLTYLVDGATSSAGSYGTLTMEEDGQWSYLITDNSLAENALFKEQFEVSVSDGKLSSIITLDIQLIGGVELPEPLAVQLNSAAPEGRSLSQPQFNSSGSEDEEAVEQLLSQFETTSTEGDTEAVTPTVEAGSHSDGGFVDLTITLPQDEFNQ